MQERDQGEVNDSDGLTSMRQLESVGRGTRCGGGDTLPRLGTSSVPAPEVAVFYLVLASVMVRASAGSQELSEWNGRAARTAVPGFSASMWNRPPSLRTRSRMPVMP